MAVFHHFTICMLALSVASAYSFAYQKKIPYIPAGTYMTGPDAFIGGDPADPNVPYCKSNEPCGYYSFDVVTKRPLKWIPSWCQCEPSYNCIYSGTNKRQKTYVHSCALQSQSEGRLIYY